MSKYGNIVGLGQLEKIQPPTVLEGLLDHVENAALNAGVDPGIMTELLTKARSSLGSFEPRSPDVIRAMDIKVFNAARNFLLEESPGDMTEAMILGYLKPESDEEAGELSFPGIYRQILESSQNSNMKSGRISGVLGGSIEPLGKILSNFDPLLVLDEFGDNSDILLEKIISVLKPEGEINLTPKSVWPRYCRTILSAADFLGQFKDSRDFYGWITGFYMDYRSRSALPLILGAEIYGMGFTLACDFLIELGFKQYIKIDSNVTGLLVSTGLVIPKSDTYHVLKAISRIAENTGVTAYEVDKVFWLIGTGYFFNHLDMGKQSRGKKLKIKFLEQFPPA